MLQRLTLTTCLLTILALSWPNESYASTCLQCHTTKQSGFNPAHAFAANSCITCHSGDNDAAVEEDAHSGLIAFPGELANAQQACGNCHAERVASVGKNLMHAATGMVTVTRQSLGEPAAPEHANNLQSLGHSVADSMLRKQCASCHIGQTRTEHKHNVMWDRGGGCLACHVNDYPQESHPALTIGVSDARCFGCHSRSGRISLNYTGLAEVDATPQDENAALRLADGRHIERMSADAHYVAGMSCIDCHTSVGLMGDAGDATHQRQAVDISCADCHDNQSTKLKLSDWPALLTSIRKHVPFAADEATEFITTANNATPLWHIEIRNDGAWLHTKNTGRVLKIPVANNLDHANDENHDRLTCSTCHSQWAPQCFGCHMQFDAEGEQWDHVDRTMTPGRWSDERWLVRNALPALGVNDENQIELFVPGMIMTVTHPEFEQDKFVRMFAPLSPHTSGKSRSCESCHDSSEALGLGRGTLTENPEGWEFTPAYELLPDGLPADAWTNIGNSLGGRAPLSGQRPLSETEIEAILEISKTLRQTR